ncbi:MAG: CAP domain-containing protein [Rubrivivax sp.]
MHFNAIRGRWLPALLCLWGLTACGGGSDSAAAEAPAVPPAPTAPTTPASPQALSTCGLSDFAAQALTRINQYRANGASCGAEGRFAATGPLAWHDALTQAADGHARDMAASNYFSHTSLDGRTLAQRINATGYVWSTAAENIAAGQRSVATVVDGWMASDGHCANLMRPAHQHLGLACAAGPAGSTYPTYWSLTLAAPR